MLKTIDELIDRNDPAWPLLRSWAGDDTANPHAILPPHPERRGKELVRLQVGTGSALGAVVYETGGIALHDGWLRILGSGRDSQARSLAGWNDETGGMRPGHPDGYIVVADDILGGFFALNCGRFGRDSLGQVFYLAPEAFDWQNLLLGYTDFIQWCFLGKTRSFYADLEDLGCWEETHRPGFDQAYGFDPLLWAREGRNYREVDRHPIGIAEAWRLKADLALSG